ncbi:Cft2 family RNA processing exonuclease [Stackebrandtia albiflava]|uniref:Cft2 family RNA processing exonuclease n=1 Tax=Stackebrandtia albiflava TaxID=406432 RepID=A0A562V5B2_9ACTN|nr:MBL fold metallo-hydrolase [Stackebrandtia albiflava]TWJ13059.1 Cft2 family RNA processing exonuclease [Stackebrandtia albiflava]
MTPPWEELPEQVTAVLSAAAEMVVARSAVPLSRDRLLETTDGVHGLLAVLTGSAGLRRLLGRRLGAGIDTEPATGLVAADPVAAERAAAAVQRLLTEHRRAQRREHRARRRAERPDAEQRRFSRLEHRVGDLRAARDRLEVQLATLREENRELRGTIENLDDELGQLRRHLEIAHARLERLQAVRDAAEEAPRPEPVPRATVGEDLSPTVRVLGGGTEIGGSCVLVTAGGSRLLIDAGTRPSGVDADSLAPEGIGELDTAPDAILVTHAHNDHAGWVPALLSRFPGVPVIASAATCDLLGTMWADSAKVMARRADSDESWAGGPLPPYRQSDVDRAVSALDALGCGRTRRVGALDVEMFEAGHIIGATGVVVTAGSHRIVVTGDVSLPGQLSVGGLRLPESAIGADLMLLESTYAGAGRLPPRQAIVDQFVADADRVLGRGGRILVPAFALGRAQEIALICRRHLPDAEVLVDGLARELSHAYQRHPGPDGERIAVFHGNVRPVEPGRTRQEIADERPCLVVSTSGMLTGGPAVAWARAILPDARSGLMVVGYQDADSPGSRLLGLADAGGGRMTLPDGDEPLEVAAHVGQYRLGAHATEDELVDVAARAQAAVVMPVHGRASAQRQFARRLQLRRQATVSATETWRPEP